MKLTSTVMEHNGYIPTPYTCDGSGSSPPLKIEDIPSQTESLVLLMEDPDVPQDIREDGMWDHWVVFNIPPETAEIMEGHEPPGKPGRGTSGETGYYPPCPPDREHRYFFKIFALDTVLDLPEGATKEEVYQAMQGHVTDQAVLAGRYERKP